MSKFWRVFMMLAAVMVPASAQVWDFTGNILLNGTYNFRELILTSSATGAVSAATIVTGTMIFNSANGTYTINANAVDSQFGSGSYSDIGTYSIAPNGQGFMDHPYSKSGSLHGMVANGMFIGSSTENRTNDLFIAVPAGSATVSNLSGTYTMNYYLTRGTSADSWDSIAQFTASGTGSIGGATVRTYLGNSSTILTQDETGITYSFSSGVGTISFPTTGQPAIAGPKQLLISPDGNFIFGGSTASAPNTFDYDFFIGVRTSSGVAPKLSGLYYQLGLGHSPGALSTYWGAFNARSGTILEHQRYLAVSNTGPLNYTGSAVYPENGGTNYRDTLADMEYTLSVDGKIRIGAGISPYLGLKLAVAGPTFASAGSNPYIDPTGVINAASYAPFTTGVAPGELMSIYGSNLSIGTAVSPGGVPFPTTLNDVQVLFNNQPGALYFVTPGQIAVLVPYGISGSVVQIQVVRKGVASNAVTAFRYLTSPGIFSQSQSGEGLGAVLHANYSLVTESNPATVGETVQIFLTGLGTVFPSVADGGLGSTDPSNLNRTTPGAVKAFIGNVPADVAYAGLAPGLAGLYQVNATVPSGAGSGNVFLDIQTTDSYTTQLALPVAPVSSSDAVSPQKADPTAHVHRR